MILAEYEQIEARARYGANDIRPGLTGWAQINGRDAVTVEEKARLDGEYRRNMVETVPAETPAPHRTSLTFSMRRVDTSVRCMTIGLDIVCLLA